MVLKYYQLLDKYDASRLFKGEEKQFHTYM